MKEGTIYKQDSGQVMFTVSASDQSGVEIQLYGRETEGLAILFDHLLDGAKWYVKNGKPESRPEYPLNQGDATLAVGQVLTIAPILPGTQVLHPAGSTIVNDGKVEWSSVEPGVYRLRLIQFPHQEKEIVVTVI